MVRSVWLCDISRIQFPLCSAFPSVPITKAEGGRPSTDNPGPHSDADGMVLKPLREGAPLLLCLSVPLTPSLLGEGMSTGQATNTVTLP